MIYIAYSKKCHSAYNVEIDETGNIVLTDINGNKAENAGHIISSMGGKEKFLSLCEEGDLAEAIAAKEERLRKEHEEVVARSAEWKAYKEEQERIAREFVENALRSGEPIEANIENIRMVLCYLNSMNWGLWQLPLMTIGYRCNQYDCDGVTATTIILDKPVDGHTHYKYGAPVGHLTKYTRIR